MHLKKLLLSLTALISIDALTAYAAEKTNEMMVTQISSPQSQIVSKELEQSTDRLIVAYTFFELGRHKEAAKEYETAILELRKHNVFITHNVYTNAGLVSFIAQNFPQAMEYYETAKSLLSSELRSRENYAFLATAYSNQSQIEDELRQINSSLSKAYLLEAQSAAMAKDWQKAAKLYKKGLKLDLDKDQSIHAVTYANIGRSHLELKNYTIAQEYLMKAIELNPTLPQIVHDCLDKAKAILTEKSD